jgi:hypothetical protein
MSGASSVGLMRVLSDGPVAVAVAWTRAERRPNDPRVGI